jgi:hypothetical protein
VIFGESEAAGAGDAAGAVAGRFLLISAETASVMS